MKVELLDCMGEDLTVVNAARHSFNQRRSVLRQEDKNLLKRLAAGGEISPFFHPQVSLYIEAPIYVARQMMRHTVGFAVSEVSRRYINTPPTFFPARPRQAARRGQVQESVDLHTEGKWSALVEEAQRVTQEIYEQLIEEGASSEFARSVLPVSMDTSWYWTGSLAAWARVCHERCAPDAQEETRHLAVEIEKVVMKLFPECWCALMQYYYKDKGWV